MKSFDPSRYFNDVELVRAARAGDARALELIIETIINWPSPDGVPTLRIFARRQAQTLKSWDEDDIVAVMRTIIWNAVMGVGNPSRYWDESRSMSLQSVCFYWLRQDIARQHNLENRLKNKGELLPLTELEIAPDLRQAQFEDMILMKCTLEKYWESFTPKQKAVIIGLSRGLAVNEIAKEMSLKEQTISWYIKKIREFLKN